MWGEKGGVGVEVVGQVWGGAGGGGGVGSCVVGFVGQRHGLAGQMG